jgi:integrase
MAKKKTPKQRVYGAGSLYLVGDVYYTNIVHNGKRLRVSTGKKTEAEALLALEQIRGKSVRNEIVVPGATADLKMEKVLKDYLVWFERQAIQGKRAKGTLHTYKSEARLHLIPFFGDLAPPQVQTQTITAYRQKREKEINLQGSYQDKKTRKTVLPKGPVKSLKDSTVNREIALLRVAMRRLAKLNPQALPVLPYFPMEAESPARTGFIKPKQFWEKLFPVLPFYLQAISVGAFFWGGRKGEWTALNCDEVDLGVNDAGRPTGYIHFDKSKNKVPRDVPVLSGPMYAALVKQKEWHDLVCPDETAFFLDHHGRQRLGDFEKAWDTARTAAGFPNLLFHDMRRSANRNMRDRGLVQGTRMQMMGQKTPSIDLRYGIIDRDNLEDAREKMSD